MNKVTIVAIVVLVVFIGLIVYGLSPGVSTQTISVGDCSATYSTSAATVSDEQLCPRSGSCVAAPELQQHNAAVDVLLCACRKAKNSGYIDAQLNSDNSALGKGVVGQQMTAQQLCDNFPSLVTKRAYE